MFIILGFYAFEEIFRAAEVELEDQTLMAEVQLDVDLKKAASKAFREARLLVEDTLRMPGTNCIKIGLQGKLILGDYFQENRTSRRPFLLLRISFPGRPIFIQLPSAPAETEYDRLLHFCSPKVIKLIKILEHSAEELRPPTDGDEQGGNSIETILA